MKSCNIALPLIIGVMLQFGVSSSMPSSPPNQPTSPPRNQRPYEAPIQDRPVFDRVTGELVAIYYKRKRIDISDMVFEEKDPNLIPNRSRLGRGGPNGMNGEFFQNKVYHDYDLHYIGPTIEPQKNDVVSDPTGIRIKGVFRDGGHYFEIVHRRTRAHKWVLP